MKNYNYYEIVFGNAGSGMTDSICIKGKRMPTFTEAREFCKKDMKKMGYNLINDVIEMTEDEAYMFFDMERECKWEVFGENNI